MSIITKFQDYRNTKFDSKIERSLLRMNDKIRYNPEFNNLTVKYMTTERRTRKLTEYMVWYMGDEYLISYFYTEGNRILATDSTADMNMFWKVAPDALVKVHTGVPGLLSNKKSRILWGNGINIDVQVFKMKDGNPTEEVDEKESNRIRDILVDTLLDKTNFWEHAKQQTEDESWSGHTALKFNFDRDITPYPIIETTDARLFTLVKERGFTTAIKFHAWHTNEKSDKKYRLDEVYTTVRNEIELQYYRQWKHGTQEVNVGDAVIKYELYELKNDKEVAIIFNNWLSKCPELTEGIENESIAFGGLQGILAFEKANRLPNNDFPGSWYGASDYSRSVLSFDKLDELISENAREVRDNKAIQFFPMEWLDKSNEGKILGKNKFKTNYVGSSNDVDQAQGAQAPAGVIEVKDKTDSLKEKFKMEIGIICANAHISPTSLGGIGQGFESIAAGPESQQEREKDTIDTRNEMIERWKPYLNKVFLKLLEFNTWLLDNGLTSDQPGISEMDIDFENCTVKVQFPDYVQSSDMERITTWGAAKTARVADTETAVENVYPHLSRKQQRDIIDRIKFEDGMVSDNPSNLSLMDLTGNDPEGGEDKTFIVTYTDTNQKELTITIEAKDADEARIKALEQVGMEPTVIKTITEKTKEAIQ